VFGQSVHGSMMTILALTTLNRRPMKGASPQPPRHAALPYKVLVKSLPLVEEFLWFLFERRRSKDSVRLVRITTRGGRSLLLDPSLVEKPWPLSESLCDRPSACAGG
jgi:hypothetical protein